MGNQEIKSAMSRIQERGFDASILTEFEAKLWRKQSIDALSGFDSHLNFCDSFIDDMLPIQSYLDREKSEIDGDEKRYHDKAMDCWQTGFANTEKRIESLKHGGKEENQNMRSQSFQLIDFLPLVKFSQLCKACFYIILI